MALSRPGAGFDGQWRPRDKLIDFALAGNLYVSVSGLVLASFSVLGVVE
jgi:hypothetical protein